MWWPQMVNPTKCCINFQLLVLSAHHNDKQEYATAFCSLIFQGNAHLSCREPSGVGLYLFNPTNHVLFIWTFISIHICIYPWPHVLDQSASILEFEKAQQREVKRKTRDGGTWSFTGRWSLKKISTHNMQHKIQSTQQMDKLWYMS